MEAQEPVLIAFLPSPADFYRLDQLGWYRVPARHAPRGLLAPIYAFYLGRAFGDRAYSVPFYARRQGHELVTRQMLLPEEPAHPRAFDHYYMLQFGPLRWLRRPIISPRWRRVLFAQTTWERLHSAQTMADLFRRLPPEVTQSARRRPRAVGSRHPGG